MRNTNLLQVLSRCVAAVAVVVGLLACPIHAQIVISEFMAENNGFLHDAEGDSPDWIELYNGTPNPVDLAGWRLTDSPASLDKWIFPSTNLPSAGFLVVFASCKNRAVTGAELHTSFQLDQAGGYLALVEPGGGIAQVINYPAQRRNITYGTGRQAAATLLASTGASVRLFVPTNDSLGLTWTLPGFDDGAWLATNTPIGYSLAPTTNMVLAVDFNDRANNTPAMTQSGFTSFVIGANGGTTPAQTGVVTRTIGTISVTLSNSSPTLGYDDRLRGTPVNTNTFTESLLLRDVIFSRDSSGTSGLDIWITNLTAGCEHAITVWSFDSGSPGSRISDWYANGTQVITNYAFNGSVLPATNGAGRFSFNAAADTNGRLLVSGRRDAASVDANNAATFGVFLNALQVAELGAPASPTEGLAGQMFNRNTTVYLRLPFTIADPAAISELLLSMKYDDGFVAYLNGQPVASRHAPALPVWNSKATSNHPSAAFEDITIIPASGLLVTGTNWLAVQVLNVETNDLDLAFLPELQALQITAMPGQFFTPPTPSLANGAGYPGYVEDTKFSVDRGFYDTPFSVTITSATTQAAVFYTLDGNVPTPASGLPYAGPVHITNTTLLRAAAYAAGLIPSDVDTHTYIFIENVLQQPALPSGYPTNWQANYPADYAMDTNVVNHPNYGTTVRQDLRAIPTLSIVTDHNSLWHGSTGIYVNATGVHNPEAGQNWERAVSAELIQPDNTTAFQVNCALRMQGNASRDNNRLAKHSFRLLFKSDHGPAKLDYNWFGGGVRRFDNVILRACFTDAWGTRYSDQAAIATNQAGYVFKGTRYRPEDSLLLRDVWVKDSQLAMGHLAGRGSFVHLYVNGLYWGVYNPCERMDSSYCAAQSGGDGTDWDVLCGDAIYDFATLKDGSKEDWNLLMALVNGGITNEPAYQTVASLVDLENLADFFILHIFAEAEDWPFHNWFAVHRRANPTNGLPATQWKFLPWDQEIVLDQHVRRNRIEVNNAETPARIYGQLRAWPEFRRLFGDRVQKHLYNNGALTASNNVARLLARAAQLDRAIVGESARWGDAREFTIGSNPGHGQTFTRDEWWWPEIQSLCANFFPAQNEITIARLRTAGLYPVLNAPLFNQFGGAVPAGFNLAMSHTNAAGVLYFTVDGSDPRVYGTAVVAPAAAAYSDPIAINSPTLVRARVQDGAEWSALVEAMFYPPQDLGKLALTEIMYNPPALGTNAGEDFEFIELKNTGTNVLNLSGLNFTAGIGFAFTNGTLLAPGGFCVLARNPEGFAMKYPGVPISGVYTGKLDNGGERLTLAHALGSPVFSLVYGDQAPWPVAADNWGYSLVQQFPGLYQAPDNGAKWRASSLPGGSPGADDPPAAIPNIVINEVLTASTAPMVDAIELHNLETTNVNVGGWFLTDDPGQPTKFRIPDGTIVAGNGWRVFDENDFNPVPGSNQNFSLSSFGDQVYLFSGDAQTNLTGYSHGFPFAASEAGVSFGRHLNSVGEEQFPAQLSLTISNQNSGPRVGPVVINEIMYHPSNGGIEYVELLNITTQAVALFDPAAPTNTWNLSGFNFAFPPNLILDPGGFLLLTATNAEVFRARYLIPSNTFVLPVLDGNLQDSGERLTLQRPAPPDTNGLAYITVDSVRYNDKAPWPPSTDGGGDSLQRLNPLAYGDDPINWFADRPSPGQPNPVDTDGDGLPDAWENRHSLSATNQADASLDSDGDGHANWQEFLAGTNPLDPRDVLIARLVPDGGGWNLQFEGVARVGYAVQSAASLPAAIWTTIAEIPARSTNSTLALSLNAGTSTNLFLRVQALPLQ